MYIGVFWFALQIGLRADNPVDGVPFVVWLSVGMVPWFFMSAMLNVGSNVYIRYPYLVNRLRFPISVISTFYTMAQFIIFLMSMIIVAVVLVLCRVRVTIYLIQAPFIAILMFVFWVLCSMMLSPLSALSRDFYNLVRALTTPLFWLSGTIFDISSINSHVIKWILAFNPISFFVTGFRAALCEEFWIWDDHRLLYPFLGVFAFVFLGALRIQHRLATEVGDVL